MSAAMATNYSPHKTISGEPFHIAADRFYCSPTIEHLSPASQVGAPKAVVTRIHSTILHMAGLLPSLSNRALTSCLDVGCNGGALTRILASSFPQTTGIDYSPYLIESATKRFPEVSFRVADARKLDCASASYDVVVCASLIHYLPDWHAVLNECSRVLKPDGFLLLEFSRFIHPAQRLLRGLTASLLGRRTWSKTRMQFREYVNWANWHPSFRHERAIFRPIDEVTSFLSSIHMAPIQLHLPRRFPLFLEDQVGIIARHSNAAGLYERLVCSRCLDEIDSTA
jgi:ubiquinone/menaquinone biosynthesis C-methylase UbiE